MVSPNERLKAGPQTGLNIGSLTPTQRMEVRTLDVRSNWPTGKNSGDFATIYYLEGDEEEAVRRFVKEHRDQLERMDWSKRNPVKSSVDQAIYDRILHELGERMIIKTETMVREDRPNGDTWLIKRDWYESRPDRRYSVTGSKVAKISGQTPEEIIDEIDGKFIPQSGIKGKIEGDERLFLEYLRTDDEISCIALTHNNEMAVKLLPFQRSERSE